MGNTKFGRATQPAAFAFLLNADELVSRHLIPVQKHQHAICEFHSLRRNLKYSSSLE